MHVLLDHAPKQVRERPSTGCCMGSVVYGAGRCTCWRVVFDVDQLPPAPPDGEDTVQTKCCADCAYRVDSPERAAGEGDDIEALADSLGAGVFYCHTGMRKAVGWINPETGETLPWEEDRDHYEPGYNEAGEPLRADGRPALICAGWAARRRAAAREMSTHG